MNSDEIDHCTVELAFYDFFHGLCFSPYKYMGRTSSSSKEVLDIYKTSIKTAPIIGYIDSWIIGAL